MAASYGKYGRLLTGGAGQITFDTSSLSLPSFKADLLGRPFELQLNVPKYDTLVVNGRVSGGADLAKLAELRGEPLPAQGEVSVNLNFSGPVKELSAMRITGPVQLSNISYRAAFLKVPARIQTATLRLTGTGVSAERIPVALGNSDVALSFSSQRLLTYMLSGERKGAIPAVEFTARSRRLDLPEVWSDTAKYGYGQLMSARLAGRKLEGRDPTEIAKERYKVAGLPPLQANGKVEVGQFINPPTEGRDVRFDVTLRDGLLELKNFGGRLYGGQLSGGLTLDLSKAQAPYPLRYEFRLQEAEGSALVSRWTRLGSAVSGKLDFNIAGDANLDEGFLPLTNAVEAAGRSAFREGKFDNFGPMVALVNKLRLEDRVATQFRELGGNFEVKGGAFHLKNWAYSAGDLKADISGSAGLGGALDLKLAMEVPPAVLERAGLLAGGGGPLDGLLNQLKRDDKPVPLAVGLGGTMSQPALKLDTDALQKTLEQRLQGTGKDLLKRLIKPPN